MLVNEFKLIQLHSFPCEKEREKKKEERGHGFFFCFSFDLVEDQKKIILSPSFTFPALSLRLFHLTTY